MIDNPYKRPMLSAFEQDLLKLATACIHQMSCDHTGLVMDTKRPFGSSGQGAILDVLRIINPNRVEEAEITADEERLVGQLWERLPAFLQRCKVVPEWMPDHVNMLKGYN